VWRVKTPVMASNDEQELIETHRIDRRASLMKATFDIIATEGFEGLRTRAVADRAGVNVATLHYYYPTKEALIGAFAQYLGAIFVSTHAPPPPSTGHDGLDRLRQEFADSEFYLSHHQDLMTVMGELSQRSARDPIVKRNLEMMVGYWHESVAKTIQIGMQDGSFRTDIDPEQATSMLIALFSGLPAVGAAGVEAVRRAVEQWLVHPDIDRERLTEPATY
jgi:AcrR family transcriptional regulator